MYNLMNIELMRHLSERLNIGDSHPSCKLYIKRKDHRGGYEAAPFFMDGAVDISVDRRYNMAADELTVTFDNKNGQLSPDYSTLKKYGGVEGLPLSGYKDVLLPFNEIGVDLGYGDQLRRVFTGQIGGVAVNERAHNVQLDCRNMYRKLLKAIDPIDKKVLLYEDMAARDIIIKLLELAGIGKRQYRIDADTIDGKDFTIPKAEFQLGMFYADAIQVILDTMSHRIYADRNGIIQVRKLELYAQTDFHVWELDDYVNMSSGEYSMDPALIRNRVVVQTNGSWQAFEDPFLMDYCNQELLSCGLEVPWAETEDQRWAAADKFFLDMRRKLRRISVAAKGNPALDIGDLIRVTGLISAQNDKYMVTGIKSSFGSGGYIDTIELEYVDRRSNHICEKAEGDYGNVDGSVAGGGMIPVMTTRRRQIVNTALSWRGTLYQWGGDAAHNKEHYGMDCSHFIWTVLEKYGLMKDYQVSKDIYKMCTPVEESALLPGDLVFYSDSESPAGIRHVGMYVGRGNVISALGNAEITNAGIARKRKKMVMVHTLGWDSGVRMCGSVPGM